jgi:hypothetical protein
MRDGVMKQSKLNGSKHFSNPICSQFHHEYHFEIFTVVINYTNFPNIRKRLFLLTYSIFSELW